MILPLQRVVDLTVERFVRLFLTMFADYNNSICIPEGSSKKAVIAGTVASHRKYCSQICYLLAVCGLVHNNKVALSFGKDLWFCFSHTDPNGVLDFTQCLSPGSQRQTMDPEMVTGLVYRVLIQDEAGRTHATTFMGLQEHTEYNKAGKANQELQVSTLAKHYTRCLDTALGAGKIHSWHRTVIIRPSSYNNLGTYKKKHAKKNDPPIRCVSPFGSSDFPRPFSSLHPIDRSQTDKDLMYGDLMDKLESMHIVWRKHERAPSKDAEQILPGVQATYERMNK